MCVAHKAPLCVGVRLVCMYCKVEFFFKLFSHRPDFRRRRILSVFIFLLVTVPGGRFTTCGTAVFSDSLVRLLIAVQRKVTNQIKDGTPPH